MGNQPPSSPEVLCPICSLTDGEPKITTPCGHTFHLDCLARRSYSEMHRCVVCSSVLDWVDVLEQKCRNSERESLMAPVPEEEFQQQVLKLMHKRKQWSDRDAIISNALEEAEKSKELEREELERKELKRKEQELEREELETLGLKRKIRELEKTCIICMEAPSEVALVPCGHASYCMPCAGKIHKCSICRKPVNERLPIYL